MFPSKELHKVWKTWLNAYRWVYNWSIAAIKNGYKGSAYDLQKLARKADRPEWVKTLPGHQLQEAVADAIDAVKQAKANRGFARFKSCRETSQVIKFKAGNFKKGSWYPTKVKGLSFRSPQGFPDESIYGTQLVWIKGKWYGIFPEYIEPTPTKEDRVIALDPGIKTFLTGFDGKNYIEIGSNDIGRIQRLCQQLDRLMSRIDLSSAKRQRRSRSVRQSAAMREAAHRLRQKIQDLIKDCHNKSASFLVHNYKLIFIPTFETSQMVVKSARKLNKKTARNLLTWSHYKFRQHLIQMADRNDVKVVLVNESYTSKTCPQCGHIHERLGGNKKFQCPKCGFSLPRDWNGARNIMIRALSATTTRFSPGAIQIIPADG
ncbi:MULTISPECIES: transposase [unclassified Moorena]|uniref:RNA-guided endonuclease InsQ/TnpB family protein n=1 Tax=unclassified Moorena TaxID=2683338 RepID=UPI0013C15B44|nr:MULTISPECIES: transposase [unclassified Moorena]NEO10126.1 transposase [Moorena sp. SIO3I8]NEP21400.1 transposase [Moorena sp. SIO3I6]